jgi:hypothetical protein
LLTQDWVELWDVTTQKPRDYRVRIEAELYVPTYKGTEHWKHDYGVEFTAFPYSDTVHPTTIRPTPAGFEVYLRNVLRRCFPDAGANLPVSAHTLVLARDGPEFPKRTNHRRNCFVARY